MKSGEAATERVWQGLLSLLLLGAIAILALNLVNIARTPPVVTPGLSLVDFDAFYIVGDLARAGRGAEAYDLQAMARIQEGELQQDGVMPWTYPPPYHLVTMALASLPRGLSQALFAGVTALAYLAVLALLAGRQMPQTLMMLLPPFAVAVSLGQNATLIGALVGLACWLALRSPPARSGWVLGLLVLKPHLGLGLALHALAQGQWGLLARAAVVAALACLAATAVLGAGIWPAFLDAVGTAGVFLAEGRFPLYRMLSVQALATTLGLPVGLAGMVQVGAAVVACGLLVWIARAGLPPRYSLAAACFGAPLLTPYFYDYDMLAAGIGLALLMPELARRSSVALRLGLIALAWLAGGWGVYVNSRMVQLDAGQRFAEFWTAPAVGAAAYLVLLAVLVLILRRRPGAAASASTSAPTA